MKNRLLLALLVTSLLSGCTLGPKYIRPEVAPPPVFRGDTMPATPTNDATSLADLKWFEVKSRHWSVLPAWCL
ncbi:MAG TPA: hypothetical protein PKE58_10270, partial [Acidobacteriota bacterium]|nr:hypothetical protein [Acidobacteriota bacterium]